MVVQPDDKLWRNVGDLQHVRREIILGHTYQDGAGGAYPLFYYKSWDLKRSGIWRVL